MGIDERIEAFISLGKFFQNIPSETICFYTKEACKENSWFTEENVLFAFKSLGAMLKEEELKSLANRYSFSEKMPKKIGVIAAGNIPLTGFHDFACVLLSGHQLFMKPSSQDQFLMTQAAGKLCALYPPFKEQIVFSERLQNIDALIASGSNNTSRYLNFYFSSIPKIIRKSRSSVAIVDGSESEIELRQLGKDIFRYFGLGCRNVSKIYVNPTLKESLADFFTIVQHDFQDVIMHPKYKNNYEYRKAILSINETPFLDSGAILITENSSVASPIAVLHTETYYDEADLMQKIGVHGEQIQCMVSKDGQYPGSVKFGEAQIPSFLDYADAKDTLKFLENI